MTFNEGMQIDTSNISTSGRGPGRGIAIGGGLGGLLIVVVALFLGVDPSTVVPQQQEIDTRGVEAPGYRPEPMQDRRGRQQVCGVPGGRDDELGGRGVAAAVAGLHPPADDAVQGSGSDRLRTRHQRRRAVLLPGGPDRVLRYRLLPGARRPVRFQRWPVGAGVRGRPRVWPPCAEPPGRPGPGAAGPRGRDRAAGCAPSCRPTATPGVWAHYAAITKQESTDVRSWNR